ncbi:hypothetical protein [Dictyobacter aurantiacus]|uniref:Protein kinase domain-containing protein n=1 Tax=Dictyobacter aurantiacus TaxID=1936993 RepID=A0A401ZCW2_9CHLR|nr:hypothetical protein [Dictyobacter aurantiacus]GCE04730.1 hypothetical protein KDAU_20590 [Dictyobacter aurantiacus]
MPDRLAYDEAMLFAAVRLKVADPELKQGKVATLITRTALGPVERPWGIEGGFAVVYKFMTRSGEARALRCFRVPIDADMRFRYERIGAFFRSHLPDITVDCSYYPDCLVVKEQGVSPSRAYPVIAMEWVDGLTLLEMVDECCRHRNIQRLRRLVQQWEQLIVRLRQCGVAHGDLAGVNVMCRTDGQMLLVDYDGVYLPEFGPGAANLQRVLLGQADYQHPHMTARPFNATMDDFSALVIYTALLALARQPELWETYAKRDAQGRLLDTNLLFTRQDYLDPDHSRLWRSLAALNEDQVSRALAALRQACQQPVEQVRFPWHLLDQAAAPGSVATTSALAVKIDRAAAATLHMEERGPVVAPGATASSFSSSSVAMRPAQGYTMREWERQFAERVAAFRQVCQREDDEEIAAAFEEISNFGHFDEQLFPPALLQRARLAQQRRSALARFRMALSTKRPQQMAMAYDASLLNASHSVTQRERSLLVLAHAFQQASNEHDSQALLTAYQAIQDSPYQRAFRFSAQELELVEAARGYQTMRDEVLRGIATDDDARIRRAYRPELEQRFSAFSADQQHRIKGALAAAKIEQALARRDYAEAVRLGWSLLPNQPGQLVRLKLQRAALRLVRQQDISELKATISRRADATYLTLTWRWPDDALVRHAVMVWSYECWPPRLANHVRQPGAKHFTWAQRPEGQLRGSCEIRLNMAAEAALYIQGYSALRDPWDEQRRWFFADGCTPTSHCKST